MRIRYELAANTFGPEEIAAAKAVLDSGRLTMGARVRQFEDEFAQWTGARHALLVNSGSSANLLMIDALLRRTRVEAPLQPGDEVLVSALSWPTSVWPLIQLGLVPVFTDVDPQTLALDLESAKSVLSPRTRAMVLIHVLGRVPDMGAYTRFCKDHNLVLAEDACESLGAHWDGRHVGNFGAMGTFSCYFSHHISTIEGGVVVTNDSALFDDLRSMRAHGWVRDRSDREDWKQRHPEFDERFMFVSTGYNVRPMELQGAIGSTQIGKLDPMMNAREALALNVHQRLKKSAPWLRLIGAELLPESERNLERRKRQHSWMTLPMVLSANAPANVEKVKAVLEDNGVETRPIIAGNLARHPAAARHTVRSAASLQQCDDLLKRGFMIGCHPVLAPGALDTLEKAIEALAGL
jgi:CDP-6-deoxy-D-xylo-4-hexulose-3-dehydrase